MKKKTSDIIPFLSVCFFLPAACPVLCSGNGQYDKGSCICYSGWKGPECDVPISQCIDPQCGGHGTCTEGTCVCTLGYKGENCAEGKWVCVCDSVVFCRHYFFVNGLIIPSVTVIAVFCPWGYLKKRKTHSHIFKQPSLAVSLDSLVGPNGLPQKHFSDMSKSWKMYWSRCWEQ